MQNYLLIPLSVAFGGSIIASICDLVTTEIPDNLVHFMMAFGILFYFLYYIFTSNPTPLLNSLLYGFSFLAFGFLLYFFGQWGGGDAKMLGAIAFLLPVLQTPTLNFPLSFLINVFFIGAAYIIVYALIFSFTKPRLFSIFFKSTKKEWKKIVSLFFLIFLGFFLLQLSFFNASFEISLKNSAYVSSFSTLAALVISFCKIVEEYGFKKRIPTSKLKVGDVLATSKIWEGLTEKEVRRIKRTKKFVWIKEGVRFAPVFFISILFSLIYGDCVSLLFSFLTGNKFYILSWFKLFKTGIFP